MYNGVECCEGNTWQMKSSEYSLLDNLCSITFRKHTQIFTSCIKRSIAYLFKNTTLKREV